MPEWPCHHSYLLDTRGKGFNTIFNDDGGQPEGGCPLPGTPHLTLHTDALIHLAGSDCWFSFHFLPITGPQTDQYWTFPSQVLKQAGTVWICEEICLWVESFSTTAGQLLNLEIQVGGWDNCPLSFIQRNFCKWLVELGDPIFVLWLQDQIRLLLLRFNYPFKINQLSCFNQTSQRQYEILGWQTLSLNFFKEESQINWFILFNTLAKDSGRVMGNKPLRWVVGLLTGLYNNISWCISISNW